MLGSQISLMGKLSIIQQKNNFQVINTQYTIRHRNQVLYILFGLDLWSLTTLSTIFQLYVLYILVAPNAKRNLRENAFFLHFFLSTAYRLIFKNT